MSLAPIILFVYNRPWHTRQTVEALQKNELAAESDLFIFADGPKPDASEECLANISKVRNYIHKIDGFKSITIEESPENKGLANSVIAGVTKIINQFGKVIVVEDDIVVSPYFLPFMNDAFTKYENNNKVSAISAFVNPIPKPKDSTFFLKYFACWGWGTWKREWDRFQQNAFILLNGFKSKKSIKMFNIDNTVDFFNMLKYQADGIIDSWAIRFYASSFLNDKLVLYPPKSLVIQKGIGNGTHSNNPKQLLKRDRMFMAMDTYNYPIKVDTIIIKQDYKMFLEYKGFYKMDNFNLSLRLHKKIFNFIKRTLHKLFK